MSVSAIASMAYEEVLGWLAYFEARPVGWREDDRVYKILQTQGVKAEPGKIFQSLRSIYENKGDAKGIKQSRFFMEMMNATGGDKLAL